MDINPNSGAAAFEQSRIKEIIDTAQAVNSRGEPLSPEAKMAMLAVHLLRIQTIPVPTFRHDMEQGFLIIVDQCTGDLLATPERMAMFNRICLALVSDMKDTLKTTRF